VHEVTAAECDADMRRSFAHGLEKDEVTWPDLILIDLLSDLVLLARLSRQRCAMLGENPLDQTTAVESP
jgi:hypothetical protein